MKPRFAFDTSSLVSLGHTDLIEPILEKLEVIVCSTVVDELVDIARREFSSRWIFQRRFLLR